MARYIGAKCKLCRREGTKLFLKGDRCQSSKCAIERRNYAPGMHGKKRVKLSEYGLQLREKQKAKRYYGVLEKQFRNYFVKADAQKGITGENLLRLLELRLDNVAYRLGLGSSRAESRQIVNHGHITVNGAKVDIPSYLCKVGDKIAIKEGHDLAIVKASLESNPASVGYVKVDAAKLSGEFIRVPERKELPQDINEAQVIEYYNRML